ncbi:MAG: MCE family protein [Acidimicrobiales bacterium]|nr:MCE family protein [Acidimicrobiales bacterium]
MRSFTERSPVVLGLVVVVLLGVSVTGALVLNAGVFKGRYSISARFTDAAGLRPGDKVRVAGVAAGEVDSVHEEDGEVEVTLRVDDGVELSGDTRAEVVVETVLGTKSVRLETGDDWDHPLRDGDVITDTGTPVEVLDLQNIGTRFFTESDGRAFDELIDSLEQVTEGKHDDVARIVRGVNRLSGELNARDDEARRLFDAAETLSRTLADRDDDLVVAVDDLNVVVGDLADRRTALHTLLAETAEAAGRLADLAGDNGPQLDAVLADLRATLDVIDRHQVDLAAGIGYLGVAIEGFASVGYSGPGDTPNDWANIFTQLIGPVAPDGIMGACGPFDRALDLAFGPDPLPCDQRDGPLPNSSGSVPHPPGLPVGGSAPTSPDPGALPPTPAPGPAGSADPVGQLLAPLLATGGSA